MSEELYYIQNVKAVGNCMLFWRPDGCGYTVDLEDAWRVSWERARSICKSRPDEDIPRPVTLIDLFSKRRVDVQHFSRTSGLDPATAPALSPNTPVEAKAGERTNRPEEEETK